MTPASVEAASAGTGRRRHLAWVLGFITLAYALTYFNFEATPGNQPYTYPMGWWGWFDQGEYLKAAYAFAAGDLASAKHYYPPLYPLLGSVFLRWSTGHPFFFLNLACLLWFSYAFLRLAGLYVHRYIAVFLLLATVVADRTLFSHFVIPWTTTLVCAFIATCLMGFVWLDESKRTGEPFRAWKIAAVALSLGAVVATRPPDAFPVGMLGVGLMWQYFRVRRAHWLGMPRVIALAVVAYAPGPLLFVGFNLRAHGALFGRYLQSNASNNGYHPPDLLEKFVSVWLDTFTLYGERGAALVQHHFWLVLAIPALLWALARGPSALRWCAVAIISLFALYLPFGDLLPNGVWRYGNVHYFKWTFPLSALLVVVMAKAWWAAWQERRHWVGAAVFVFALPLLVLSWRFDMDYRPAAAQVQRGSLEVQLPSGEVDMLMVHHLDGPFHETYFGEHKMFVDGVELRRVRDFRLLPAEGGTRVLFIRPVRGSRMQLLLDPKMSFAKPADVFTGSYGYTLGWPWRFGRGAELPPALYRPGSVIDFSNAGGSASYLGRGWSDAEDWGRWSVGRRAIVRLALADAQPRDMTLEVAMGVFVPDAGACQKVRINVNGTKVGEERFCGAAGANRDALRSFKVPAAALGEMRSAVRIEFVTKDSTSPAEAGVNSDPRVLGVAVRSLALKPS